MRLSHLAALLLASLVTFAAYAADEISLFDGAGNAVAYIALTDGLTIYLWSGRPVSYLEPDGNGGYQVYGFNGRHLGWYVNGVIWDHSGHASCATKELLQSTQYEPFKSFKEFMPFKAFAEYAPFRPAFSESFGDERCSFLLSGGR